MVETYDYIRVAHLGYTLTHSELNSTFLNPASQLVDDGGSDIEGRIINTFTLTENEDFI